MAHGYMLLDRQTLAVDDVMGREDLLALGTHGPYFFVLDRGHV